MFSILVAHAAELNLSIPGPLNVDQQGVLGWIQNGYVMALGLAGVLALGSIVYGAVQYSVSRGNPSKLADAQDRIVQAFIGILLLVGAGTILSIINPGLLSLQLPNLGSLSDTQYQGVAINGTLTEENTDNIPLSEGNNLSLKATQSCAAKPSNCSSLSAFTCKHSGSCIAHNVIVQGLTAAAKELGVSGKGIVVTDAYPSAGAPATLSHCSKMHYNGCAMDIVLPASYAKSCADVSKFVDALTKQGVYVLNEYRTGSFSTCGKAGSGHSTGNHLHLEGCPKGTWDGLSQNLISRLNSDPKCQTKK